MKTQTALTHLEIHQLCSQAQAQFQNPLVFLVSHLFKEVMLFASLRLTETRILTVSDAANFA